MQETGSSTPTIWAAALEAAGCRAIRPGGGWYRVRWQCADDHIRFHARHEVVVFPLGVRLSPGETLEVRWQPNETAYSLAVRPSGSAFRSAQ